MINLLLVLLFVLIGGVFAATEMALVSLRESQIRQMERGRGAAQTVARLARDSGLFLSAVQIGVTFAGFFSSAFGASTVAPQIAPYLERVGMGESAASISALVLMTILISYLSLVLGELVPKRIAMQQAQRVSLVVAPPLKVFATLMRPVIWIVDASSAGVLRLLGFDPDARAADMVAYPADRPLGEVAADVTDRPYSRYPVYGESLDDIVGFIHVRDMLEHIGRGDEPVGGFVRPIASFPGAISLPEAMSQMRASGQHIAMVVDEYGGTDGMVTLEDLLEELVGEIWDEYDTGPRREFLRLHESRHFAGATNLEDFADATGVQLPDGPYETVAGWLLTNLGRLGRVGDVVTLPPEVTADPDDDSDGADAAEPVRYELEITEVSGNRIVTVELRKTSATA